MGLMTNIFVKIHSASEKIQRGIEITEETFEAIASKIQDELADIIKSKKQINDYELIVYKYLFISELKIPLLEDLGIEITEDSFILYIIPDSLEFSLLRKLDDNFNRFNLCFMPNSYNLLKLKFILSD
jgi:hypothetical protein